MPTFVFEVIGFQRVDFTTQDGKAINGFNIWVTYPGKSVEGVKADKLFMSDFKLESCCYTPCVGDHVSLSYNRFGKVESISLA